MLGDAFVVAGIGDAGFHSIVSDATRAPLHLVQRWVLNIERLLAKAFGVGRFLLHQRRLLLGQAMKRAQAPD